MIIQNLLDKEDYSNIDPSVKDSLEYKITYLIKEEIRKHKWNEGTRNRNLSWEEAREEWLSLYRDQYLNSIKSLFRKSSKKKKISIKSSYVRRNPVITGGLV